MSNLIELQVQEPDREMILAANATLHDSEGFAIRSPAAATEANTQLRHIKIRRKQLDDMRKQLVAPIDEARGKIQALFREPLEALKHAETNYKNALLDYQREERRIAQEAARRETERLRKLAEAKAKRAEKRGDTEAAEELREQPIIVPTAAPTALEGTSVLVLWRAELVDIRELCRAIADGKAPADLVRFDQAAGNRLATALKDAADVPGVRFTREESMAVRS